MSLQNDSNLGLKMTSLLNMSKKDLEIDQIWPPPNPTSPDLTPRPSQSHFLRGFCSKLWKLTRIRSDSRGFSLKLWKLKNGEKNVFSTSSTPNRRIYYGVSKNGGLKREKAYGHPLKSILHWKQHFSERPQKVLKNDL